MTFHTHRGRLASGHAGGGIGHIGTVGAGHDAVADRVANDVVVAVLVSGEDDELESGESGGETINKERQLAAYLSSRSKIYRDFPAEDTAGLVGENEGAGLALGVGADACCQAAGDEHVVVVRNDIDVGSGAGEVNAGFEGTVVVTDNGGSAGYGRECRTSFLECLPGNERVS